MLGSGREEAEMSPERLSMTQAVSEAPLCAQDPLGRKGSPRVHRELMLLNNAKAPTECQERYLSLFVLL